MNKQEIIDEIQARLMSKDREIHAGSGMVFLEIIPRMYAVDGFNISIQTGDCHYCSPRSNKGPWTHVEMGFPSQEEPAIAEWAECPDDLVESVYAYAPIDVIAEVFEKLGGIASEEDAAEMRRQLEMKREQENAPRGWGTW